mmetsp:Transcript_42106/g.90439  ORF Transcript_42106/g.90439 Transcript_42106/m.90439 type:complete len:221 (+) Transcript_42106:275-937(+)
MQRHYVGHFGVPSPEDLVQIPSTFGKLVVCSLLLRWPISLRPFELHIQAVEEPMTPDQKLPLSLGWGHQTTDAVECRYKISRVWNDARNVLAQDSGLNVKDHKLSRAESNDQPLSTSVDAHRRHHTTRSNVVRTKRHPGVVFHLVQVVDLHYTTQIGRRDPFALRGQDGDRALVLLEAAGDLTGAEAQDGELFCGSRGNRQRAITAEKQSSRSHSVELFW